MLLGALLAGIIALHTAHLGEDILCLDILKPLREQHFMSGGIRQKFSQASCRKGNLLAVILLTLA